MKRMSCKIRDRHFDDALKRWFMVFSGMLFLLLFTLSFTALWYKDARTPRASHSEKICRFLPDEVD